MHTKLFIFAKKWNKILIFYGLNLYAIYTTIALGHFVKFKLISVYSLLVLAILSLSMTVFNYLLHIVFPKKRSIWNINYTMKLLKKIDNRMKKYKNGQSIPIFTFFSTVVFFSPFSIILKSLGLSIFILSFFNEEISFLWHNIKIQDDIIFKSFGKISIYPFFVLLIVLSVSLLLNLIKNIFQKDLTKHAVLFGIILSSVFLEIIIISNSSLFSNVSNKALSFSIFYVRTVVGFIPIGWFYDLFIKPIINQKAFFKKKKILTNFRN